MLPYRPQLLYIDESVIDAPLVRRVRAALPGVEARIVEGERAAREAPEVAHQMGLARGKRVLLLARNRGRFLKPFHKNYGAPGAYLNGEETMLEFSNQCPMECTYCILQSLLNSPIMTMYANVEDAAEEIGAAERECDKPWLRIGTGEYADSLVLEPLTGFHAALIGRLGEWPRAVIEMKTKTAEVAGFEGLAHAGRAVAGWSLNAPTVAREEELLTATLDERLAAAARMQAWGYPVALHFDPLIWFPGCEREYAALAERVFAEVDPARVIWASVGALRFPPAMKRTIERRFPKSKIVYGELVPGADGKLRYVREVRRRLFGALIGGLAKYMPAERIVFSMEAPDIWAEFLGARMESARDIARRMDACCDKVNHGKAIIHHRDTETQREKITIRQNTTILTG